MSSVSALMGESLSVHPLRGKFLKWQCRTRQMMMRDGQGRPDASVMPELFLPGQDASLGAIITVMNKLPAWSVTPEFQHMARKTNDPAQRRSQALQFFSAAYYQKHHEFSDVLTATFAPGSAGAAKILDAGQCRLRFEAYNQRFELACAVQGLTEINALFQATLAHNRLFNPNLPAGTMVLGFEPDWARSSATP